MNPNLDATSENIARSQYVLVINSTRYGPICIFMRENQIFHRRENKQMDMRKNERNAPASSIKECEKT
jgi:hypothetical protein